MLRFVGLVGHNVLPGTQFREVHFLKSTQEVT